MRRFVVVAHEAPTGHDFSLDDLAGGAGRLDVLCRCVADALLTSHGVREDTEIWLVVRDAVTVRLEGASVRNLSPDERAVAGLLRSGLEAAERAVGEQWVDASPGVSATKQGLEAALRAASEAGDVVRLHWDGDPVEALEPLESVTFVLSDHRDLTPEEQELVEAHADATLSLGPTALHADQAIAVVHNVLDRLAD